MKHFAFGSLALATVLSAFSGKSQTPKRHPWPLRENMQKEKLFWVPDPTDTARCTGSVETASGKRILPTGFILMSGCEDVPEQQLYGNFTLIAFHLPEEPATDTAMHYSYGFVTFDQQGRFLHHPFIYDNGPDYWREGRRRVVEAGKMGLVNRQGKEVISLGHYRYLESPQRGVVLACRDCSFYNPNHEEHGGEFKGTDWDVLDADGKLLAQHVSLADREASRWQSKVARIPVTPTIQKLAAQLMALPQTAAYAALYSTPLNELRYVCYDVPSKESPYYHFGLDDKDDSYFPGGDAQVLISPDGREVYQLAEDLQLEIPEKEWKVEVVNTDAAK